MERPTLILLGMAGILAAGLALSTYANMAVFEEIIVTEDTISAGMPLEITAPIPPGTGVFALDVRDHTPDTILMVHVLGPLGYEVVAEDIGEAQYEGTFEVDESYEYTLVIQNDGVQPVQVVAALGPMPDPGKTALGFVSLYLLLVGVVGVVISTMYLIWWRRRN